MRIASVVLMAVTALQLAVADGAGANEPPKTRTGIALNTEWKLRLYEFAEKHVVHPSWGLAHSERNYQNSLQIAQQEKIEADLDVLFASAFLHDLGGLPAYQKKGVDHAVRSVELAEPLLKGLGFPEHKFPEVKEMILGHTYYGDAPKSAMALAFRDADILDFLGSLGVVRIVAAAQEPGRPLALPLAFDLLHRFSKELPEKLSLPSARASSAARVQEMKRFFESVEPYTFGGKAF